MSHTPILKRNKTNNPMDYKPLINRRKSIANRVHNELGNLLEIEDGVDKYWDKVKEEMMNDDDIVDFGSCSDSKDEISFPTTGSESFGRRCLDEEGDVKGLKVSRCDNNKILRAANNNEEESLMLLNNSGVSDPIINNFINQDCDKSKYIGAVSEVNETGMFMAIDNSMEEVSCRDSNKGDYQSFNEGSYQDLISESRRFNNENCQDFNEFDFLENPKKRKILKKKTNKNSVLLQKTTPQPEKTSTESFITDISDYFGTENEIIPLLITPHLETALITMKQFSYVRSNADSSFSVIVQKGSLYVEIEHEKSVEKDSYFVKKNAHFMVSKGSKYYFRNEKSMITRLHVSFLVNN